MAEEKYVSGMNTICAYNPERESGEEFRERYNLELYSEDYDEFLQAVDAVYIASPNETHYDYARKAIVSGKHVLCENPLALTRQRAEELFTLAKERDVVVLEGIKTAYCPGFQQLINVARSGQIGEIRDIEACFTSLANHQMREMTDVEYGGGVLGGGGGRGGAGLEVEGGGWRGIQI